MLSCSGFTDGFTGRWEFRNVLGSPLIDMDLSRGMNSKTFPATAQTQFNMEDRLMNTTSMYISIPKTEDICWLYVINIQTTSLTKLITTRQKKPHHTVALCGYNTMESSWYLVANWRFIQNYNYIYQWYNNIYYYWRPHRCFVIWNPKNSNFSRENDYLLRYTSSSTRECIFTVISITN